MPRPPRTDDDLLQELAAVYSRGLSIRAIASMRGWSYGATHLRLHIAAQRGLLQVRPRGQHVGRGSSSAPAGR